MQDITAALSGREIASIAIEGGRILTTRLPSAGRQRKVGERNEAGGELKTIGGEMLHSIDAGSNWFYRPLVRILGRILIVGLAAVALAACNSGNKEASASAAEPKAIPAPAAADPQPVAVDACALFSADDAKRILGAAVRPTPSAPGGCSYEQKPASSQQWEPSVSLNVRQYRSASDANSAWSDLKVLRHLEPGRKNLTALNGMGKEAYLENVPDRNAVDVSVIVHTEKSDFQLKQVTDRTPATDELKAIAQRIAGKVP